MDGDIITITESKIYPPVDGVYRWTNRGGDLLFELIEDPCSDRPLTPNNAILKPLHADQWANEFDARHRNPSYCLPEHSEGSQKGQLS